MEKTVYYYDEIIRWIEEEKITIWDLALKLDLSISSSTPLENLLRRICNNNILKADKLKKQLKENSRKYARENRSGKKLNYITLLELANKGYGSTEIMKIFGYTKYQQYTDATTKMVYNENINRSVIKDLKSKIKYNRKNKDVEILPGKKEDSLTDIADEEISSNSVSIQNTEKTNENLVPCEVVSSVKGFSSHKIVMYTYEYLKDEDFETELLNFEEEKIILSVTLNKFISDGTIPTAKKIALSNAINDPKINLRVLMAMSNYEKKNVTTNLAYENDLIISQALMLAGYTDKEIYIAAKSHLTLLNVMTLGFGIRLSKRHLINDFCDIQDKDSLTYFDYKRPGIDLSALQNKKAYVLDTCVLIGSTDEIADASVRITRTKIRNSILTNKEEKILFYSILREVKSYDVFSSIIHAAKLNPSIKIILDMHLLYEYSDISILNLSMYFKRKYNMDVTLLTHDFKLYTEALQYNFKVVFCNSEQWLAKFKSDNKISYSLEEKAKVNEDDAEKDNNIYKTLSFNKVKDTFVLLNNSTFEKVMDENRKVLPLIGHRGFKFYQAEIGSLIKFRNDPCYYSVRAFEGQNNLVAI